MSFEQPNYDPSGEVERFFKNNRKKLKEYIRAALKANKYKKGTEGFMKQVVGKIPDGEFYDYKKEIEKLTKEVEQENPEYQIKLQEQQLQEARPQEKKEDQGSSQKERRQLQEARLQEKIDDAEDLAQEEEKRTGYHPEEYNEE